MEMDSAHLAAIDQRIAHLAAVPEAILDAFNNSIDAVFMIARYPDRSEQHPMGKLMRLHHTTLSAIGCEIYERDIEIERLKAALCARGPRSDPVSGL